MPAEPTSPAATPGPPAVVLLSGGLDSTTCLALATAEGFAVHAISFDYGQRHTFELAAARANAATYRVADHRMVRLDFDGIGGSALTDASIGVPKDQVAIDGSPATDPQGIPSTYVPARNLTFLSIALGYAEVVGARDIFIGTNAVDYSGYPDCRPSFLRAFQEIAGLATSAGVTGRGPDEFTIHTPLARLSKGQIVQLGTRLGVDYGATHSCYDPDPTTGAPCTACDACRLRARGFREAGLPDPVVAGE